ncbi:ATP-binding protein [Streptomyces sp. DSM 116496]|uniref:ATP-binding protein n=1 Tax=Streptomyces stoeckheimensis TaxID=3344656 RepID=UPI0038B30693
MACPPRPLPLAHSLVFHRVRASPTESATGRIRMIRPNRHGDPVPGVVRDRALPRSYRSSRAARSFVRETAAIWGVRPARVDDLVLCVSELATNAVLHGTPCAGRFFLVRLLAFDDTVRIEVHDTEPTWRGSPTDTTPADATAGRGLPIVAALSDEWGVLRDHPGKAVWAEFRDAAPPRVPASLGGRPQTRQFNHS